MNFNSRKEPLLKIPSSFEEVIAKNYEIIETFLKKFHHIYTSIYRNLFNRTIRILISNKPNILK